MQATTFQSAAHKNLRILCLIRLIPLTGLLAGGYWLSRSGDFGIHGDFLLALLVGFSLVIATTWVRSYRPTPISRGEFFIHLLVDILVFSLLMFNAGGASNPFVSYYLVPVAIAAITLPALLTWTVGLLCVGAYSLLVFWHMPLPALAPTAELHEAGMWLNFLVSAVLIAFFVNRMATTLRTQEEELNRERARQLEDDQLLAVATLAASAAHELGTPLNTLNVIADDWVDNPDLPEPLREDATLMGNQIRRCRETLQRLAKTGRDFSTRQPVAKPARDYFLELTQRWQLMRPDIRADIQIDPALADANLRFHPALSASIQSLLDNAADASPRWVAVRIERHGEKIHLQIRDRGEGLDPDQLAAGPVDSGKPGGLGLGLYLARSILARHGGAIRFENEPGGGTRTLVDLPLESARD